MVTVSMQFPEGALASLHAAPDEFAKELRLVAAVKWYELGRVSQGRAAEIAGLSRAEFLSALGRLRVSPFQEDAADVLKEAQGG